MAAAVNGHVIVKNPRVWCDVFHLQRLRQARYPAFGLDGAAGYLYFYDDAMGDGEDGPTHQPVEQL